MTLFNKYLFDSRIEVSASIELSFLFAYIWHKIKIFSRVGTMSDQYLSIKEATQSIIDEFSLFEDWMERYEYIIELGQNLDNLPDEKKIDMYRVKGCQSQVWFVATENFNRIRFEADSDAMIVRGLISLLLRVYSNRTPDEIAETPPDFFEAVNLGSHLSGNRANGLAAMVAHIQSYGKIKTEI